MIISNFISYHATNLRNNKNIIISIHGFVASNIINIKLHVLATAITYLPRPFPSFAPSIIPGRSSSYILVPL